MLGLVIRGFFLVGIISWYSAGLMKFINSYFLTEYQTYLAQEFKRNKHLRLQDADMPPMAPEVVVEQALSPDQAEPFIEHGKVKTCERNLCHLLPSQDELDYSNQPTTADRKSQDDDFIHYWMKRRKTDDNAGDNLHCRAQLTTCEENNDAER
jgi:hypothetical protein